MSSTTFLIDIACLPHSMSSTMSSTTFLFHIACLLPPSLSTWMFSTCFAIHLFYFLASYSYNHAFGVSETWFSVGDGCGTDVENTVYDILIPQLPPFLHTTDVLCISFIKYGCIEYTFLYTISFLLPSYLVYLLSSLCSSSCPPLDVSS